MSQPSSLPSTPPRPEPAISIKKSVTPDDYRAKWVLPADYPMVAPNYAQARSEMAKTIGLGQRGRIGCVEHAALDPP
jgi:predicted transcriptional regulator